MELVELAIAATPVIGGVAAYSKWSNSPRQCAKRDLATIEGLPQHRVRAAEWAGDVLTVRVDSPADSIEWAAHRDAIGEAFGRHAPRITDRDDGVTIRSLPKGRRPELDALGPWETTPPETLPPLDAIPVARTAYGKMWRLPVLGSHVLVIGATGAGKGSVLWSLTQQLAPGVKSGEVHLWGLDPKGGVELALGREMYRRVAFSGSDTWEQELADLLRDAVQAMNARLVRMRERRHRKVTPSVDEPLIVLVIDEFLTLTLGIADRKLATQIDMDLMKLLSQGRAAGVSVIACAQLAQKAALSDYVRDLFPVRVGLRMADRGQVDMAMGPEARAAGAECHQIPYSHPGVAYVYTETRGIEMVRFPWVGDEAILGMCRVYGGADPTATMAPVEYPRPALAPVSAAVQVEPVTAPPAGDESAATSKAELAKRAVAAHPGLTAKELAELAGVSIRLIYTARRELEVAE